MTQALPALAPSRLPTAAAPTAGGRHLQGQGHAPAGGVVTVGSTGYFTGLPAACPLSGVGTALVGSGSHLAATLFTRVFSEDSLASDLRCLFSILEYYITLSICCLQPSLYNHHHICNMKIPRKIWSYDMFVYTTC